MFTNFHQAQTRFSVKSLDSNVDLLLLHYTVLLVMFCHDMHDILTASLCHTLDTGHTVDRLTSGDQLTNVSDLDLNWHQITSCPAHSFPTLQCVLAPGANVVTRTWAELSGAPDHCTHTHFTTFCVDCKWSGQIVKSLEIISTMRNMLQIGHYSSTMKWKCSCWRTG